MPARENAGGLQPGAKRRWGSGSRQHRRGARCARHRRCAWHPSNLLPARPGLLAGRWATSATWRGPTTPARRRCALQLSPAHWPSPACAPGHARCLPFLQAKAGVLTRRAAAALASKEDAPLAAAKPPRPKHQRKAPAAPGPVPAAAAAAANQPRRAGLRERKAVPAAAAPARRVVKAAKAAAAARPLPPPPSSLPDVDYCDRHDPLAVNEWVNEIFAYYKRVEPLLRASPDYMSRQVGSSRRRGQARAEVPPGALAHAALQPRPPASLRRLAGPHQRAHAGDPGRLAGGCAPQVQGGRSGGCCALWHAPHQMPTTSKQPALRGSMAGPPNSMHTAWRLLTCSPL